MLSNIFICVWLNNEKIVYRGKDNMTWYDIHQNNFVQLKATDMTLFDPRFKYKVMFGNVFKIRVFLF